MQPTKKSFSIDTDAYTVLTTYQPAHVLFQVTDKRTNLMKGLLLEDSTLPDNIKEECEEVGHLYEFLQHKQPQEIQVDQDKFKFRVVNIRKEKWYSLNLEEVPPNTMQRESKVGFDKMEQEPSLLPSRGQLLQQNEALKQQIKKQKAKEGEQVNPNPNPNLNPQEAEQANPNPNPNLNPSPSPTLQLIPKGNKQTVAYQLSSRRLILSPNLSCRGAIHYQIKDNVITKQTDDLSMLVFKQRIKRESVHCSVRVDSYLQNNWIIFGVIGEKHFNKSYCYFEKDCIAFSGSLGIVFNQLDIIDLKLQIQQGDTIKMQVNQEKRSMQWSINGVVVCKHNVGTKMLRQGFYPYVMLAMTNDRLILNTQ